MRTGRCEPLTGPVLCPPNARGFRVAQISCTNVARSVLTPATTMINKEYALRAVGRSYILYGIRIGITHKYNIYIFVQVWVFLQTGIRSIEQQLDRVCAHFPVSGESRV